jgi:hypothetical protein
MAEDQVVQDVVEDVEQIKDDVIELGVDVAKTTSTTPGKVALVLGGAIIGASISYYYTKKYLAARYNKIAEDEIADMRAHYLAKERAAEEKKPIDEVMEEHGYSTKLEGPEETVYVKIEPEPTEEPEDPKNVFRNYNDHWDYAIELPTRTDDVPYVIHKDEYFGSETDFEQMTLTYFEGDDVLADSNDTPVDDQDAMVGLGNLAKFGHGSGDPNVVYVRNVELQLEIEIMHSDGLYSEEVHGISDDGLKHSDRRTKRHLHTRRRRQHDDI